MVGRQVPKPRRDGYKRPFDLTVLTQAHLLLLVPWLLLWTSIAFHTLYNYGWVPEGVGPGASPPPYELS